MALIFKVNPDHFLHIHGENPEIHHPPPAHHRDHPGDL